MMRARMVCHLRNGSEMAAHPLVNKVMCHLSLFNSRDQGHSWKQLPNQGRYFCCPWSVLPLLASSKLSTSPCRLSMLQSSFASMGAIRLCSS